MKKAIIYYFSGCGNTKLIAENVSDKLKNQDFDSCLVNIENPDINMEKADLYGFIFPVYGFGLPHMVVKFINKLPKMQKQKAFMFLTPAGHEGAAIFQGLVLLKNKGFDVIRAHPVYMPDTWLLAMSAPSDEKFQESYAKSRDKIDKYINEMLENKKSLSIANPILIVLLGLINIMFHFIGRHQSGKTFISNNKCNSCKKCLKECSSTVIKWQNNKPYWGWNCEQCYRCINTCPNDAVEISGFAMLISMSSIFWAHNTYKLIPDMITQKLNFLSPLPEIIILLLAVFLTMRIAQMIAGLKFMPKWYLTKTRKRYKINN